MAGLTGLFVARDGSNNGTTPTGARQGTGGLLTQSGGSLLQSRVGVLADNGSATVVTGAANMSYNVRAAAFVTQVTAGNGPVIAVNDATANVVTTAAPGSNSRYDVVWVRQHLVTGDGGSDTNVIFEPGVTQGVVAASPTVPVDGAGANQVPVGATRLANILVTTGMTATNTATISQVFDWTVSRGGVLPVRTAAQLSSLTPHFGQTVADDSSGTMVLKTWNGSSWAVVPTTSAWTTATLSGSWAAFGGSRRAPSYRKNGDVVELQGAAKSGGAATLFTLPVGFRPAFQVIEPIALNAGIGYCEITTAGVVQVFDPYTGGGLSTLASIDGITFSTV